MNTKKQNKEFIAEQSGENVFLDINQNKSEAYLAKVKIAKQINALILDRQLKQTEVAELLGVDQPKISAISRGQLSGFSLERLIDFFNRLKQSL